MKIKIRWLPIGTKTVIRKDVPPYRFYDLNVLSFFLGVAPSYKSLTIMFLNILIYISSKKSGIESDLEEVEP